ncbi:MAG: MlaD family protein [Deltaproteobacteria bacterium]|nr:MlaD family protein [Deltaproteobacteria bacterium]
MPEQPTPSVPQSQVISRRRTPLSAVWVIPIIAALVGAWVAVTRILDEGPKITVIFANAEGLEAGKTTVHYNGVDVGTVTGIHLTADHLRVVLTIQMAPKTDDFLVEDTTFWVVRPRISGANVSGLGTLISGAYIGMDIGQSKQARREFAGLDTPPVVTPDAPGRFFRLTTPELGSLDTGTPIYFRRLQVGQVVSYALDDDGKALTIKVFVKQPYDKYVTRDTRFWQASGIDVSLTASGLSVQTQSLLSILIGGIAFETPASDPPGDAATADTEFTLYGSRTDAFQAPARHPQKFVLVFSDSVRGLTVGAPVEFRGIPIGQVSAISAQIDAKTFEFSAPVTVELDAQRLGVQLQDLPPDADLESLRRDVINRLVAHGIRAQLQTGNLLTGALFVTFDFHPEAPPATVDWSTQPPRLPTAPGQFQALEARLANIVKKIDEMPLQAIGNDLRKSIADLDRLLVGAEATLDKADTLVDNADALIQNANRMVEPNSLLGTELATTLQELTRAARSLRVLTDYLERHPEALIRGKTGEAK